MTFSAKDDNTYVWSSKEDRHKYNWIAMWETREAYEDMTYKLHMRNGKTF